ncbi:MAG: hypothetical protein FJY77_02895 [Candidatus Altiarchaeales archaeon]|nr:hypothetical protein [Candidatus Altiarchaeales archaeon]
MKASTMLSALASLISLGSYILLGVSVLTVLSTFSSLMPEEGREPFKAEVSPAGDAVFSLTVGNTGFFENTVNSSIRVEFKDNVVEKQAYLKLKPKESGELKFEFNLTQRQMESILLSPPKIFLFLKVDTLNGLAGMGVKAEIGGISSK